MTDYYLWFLVQFILIVLCSLATQTNTVAPHLALYLIVSALS